MPPKSPSILSESSDTLKETQPIEYVVLSGGGVRGDSYPGSHKALRDAGVMEGVKAIAGSSAGAITAAFIASGINPENLAHLSRTNDLKGLVGKGILPGVKIRSDGAPLYHLLSTTIKNNIKEFLEERQTKQPPSPAVPRGELQHFTDLQRRAYEENGKISFKDLALLRKMDPTKFKDLVVTAVEYSTSGKISGSGELQIFSADTTPEVEIALACKASGAFPGVFQTVPIEVPDIAHPGRTKTVRFGDGGWADNTPTEYFNHLEEIKGSVKNYKNKTLVFAFGGEKDDIHRAIYSARKLATTKGKVAQFLKDAVIQVAFRIRGTGPYAADVKNNKKIREDYALRTVTIDTQHISALSFAEAKKHAEYLRTKGYAATMQYMRNHDVGKAKSLHPHFELQQCLLNVYEQEVRNPSFVNKLMKVTSSAPHKNKMQSLLSYCSFEDSKFTDKDTTPTLQAYIKLATRTNKGTYSSDTRTIKTLIKTLNDSKTPTEVKNHFMEALRINTEDIFTDKGIKIKKIDKRLKIPKDLKGKSKEAALLKKQQNFKFTASDVSRFLKKEIGRSTNSLTSTDSSRNSDTASTITDSSSRSDSFVAREEARRNSKKGVSPPQR